VRVLVTGAGGFVGPHLTRELVGAGHDVVAMVRRAASARPASEAVVADLLDGAALVEAVRTARPEAVVHLAAQSAPSAESREVARTLRVNVEGTARLLEAVRAAAAGTRVLVAGSGMVYGRAAGPRPVDEQVAPRPVGLYATSKLCQELIARQLGADLGLEVLVCRPFNHTGPGQDGRFALGSFAAQVVQAERAGGGAVRVGDLSAVRDFLDVRDVVRAYRLLLEADDPPDVANVASGIGRRMGDLLEVLIAGASVAVEVVVERDRMRPSDVPVLVGDAGRLRARGWTPQIPLERTLDDLLASARAAAA
jgi:GDP-4-dehydro-6-deoxy-D-mannose reductase